MRINVLTTTTKRTIPNLFSDRQHQQVKTGFLCKSYIHKTLLTSEKASDVFSVTTVTSQCEWGLPLCSLTIPGGKAQLGKTKNFFGF